MTATSFRLKSKSLFLTFPQCDFPLENFCQKVNEFFAEHKIIKGVASREQHEDGNYHLHLYVNLQKECQTRNVNYFDNLVSPAKHPNIVSRLKGGALKTIQYVIKDGVYQVLPDANSFDLTAFLEAASNKKSTKISLIVEMIERGETSLDEIDNEHPEYVALHKKSLQEYLDFRVLKSLRQSRALALQEVFHVSPASGHNNSYNQALALWLNQNIRTPTPRKHRTPQLWLRAAPRMGKTTMIEYLTKEFTLSVYHWPKDEKWWDGYSDGCFDLIVLDEYKAHKKITELNPILSGDTTPLSRRSTCPYLKKENLPVIILSNFLPQECYHKAQPLQLAPLLDRLTIIDFGDNPVRIEKNEPVPVPDTPPCTFSDPDLDLILSELPVPEIDEQPSSSSSSFIPTVYQEYPELDPNSDFFFSDAYRKEVNERAKRSREEITPVQTVRLSRAMRSIQPRRHKAPRNNSVISQFFDEEAQDSQESDASESDVDELHSSDEDFLDDSDPLVCSSPSPPVAVRPVRRVRFLIDSP